MQPIHTTYIKDTSDKTGKTYRELEALWAELTRDVENDRMMNPNEYSHLRKLDGTMAEEVKRRFEKTLFNPEPEPESELPQPELQQEDEELATDIENNLEMTESDEIQPVEGESLEEGSPAETPEEVSQTEEQILDDVFAEEI